MPQPKKKSTSSLSREDLERSAWEAALRKVVELQHEVIPDGWMNYEQFAEKMGVCREVAALKLRQLARAGLCERKDFRVQWGSSATRPRPYFRLKS
jgi:hypothetical protein